MTRYLDDLVSTLKSVSIQGKNGAELGFEEGMKLLLSLFLTKKREGRTACFIGNGGSAAIATHMTTDFFKNGGMKVASPFDLATMTCIGNDYGYEHIFSKQVERMMGAGDLLIAVSSSGKSPNIVNAIDSAHENGAEVLSFTGFSPDNPARTRADYSAYVPSGGYGVVESCHNLMLQELVDKMKERVEWE